MSQFINITDYDASIHREILDAVSRQDEAIIEVIEDRAIAEMKGYLFTRYNTDLIFATQGTDRHQLILMFAIDIAIYHLFCIHNPVKLSQMRKDRYDRALAWLKQVGNINNPLPVEGLPLRETDPGKEAESPYLMRSNPKRANHY